MSIERFLHVGLHGIAAQGDTSHLLSDDQSDVYGAFTQAAAAAGLAWSRLDGSSPRTVQWGMNDAGLGERKSEVAWVQVAPTVRRHERFPLLPVSLVLRYALASIADVRVHGLHAVAPMEEFRERPADLIVGPMPGPRDPREVKVVVDVDVSLDAPPSDIAAAVLKRSRKEVSEVSSAVRAEASEMSTGSGLWRLYGDPARDGESKPCNYRFECIPRSGEFIHLPAIAESFYAGLAYLGASGPAHVKVVSQAQ